MAKGIVTISGDTGFDGTYEIAYEDRALTNWEYHIIKKIAGVRAGEFQEASRALDLDVVVALAVISLIRDGKVDKTRWKEASDLLMDAEGGDVLYHEVTDVPPAEAPPTVEQPSGASNATTEPSSNDSSSTSDDPPEITPTPTGVPV